MTPPEHKSTGSSSAPLLLRNWVSLIGGVLAASSFFAVLCLLAIDFFAEFTNPYLGILTYLVAPVFLVSGLFLVVVGAWLERRARRKLVPGEVPYYPRIDFNIPRHRKTFYAVLSVSFVFLLITALGSYRTYHFTESVEFCGKTCHTVMKPEFTAYQNSPHARVSCAKCHVGPGAAWYMRFKLAGTYQVAAVLAGAYPRPIPVPIKHMRPAADTCEKCHWPKKFHGNVEKLYTHFLSDEKNSPWTLRLLLKVGGADPTHGPIGGIHWHMNVANRVEYIATDPKHQNIPWVRMTNEKGEAVVYQGEENKLKPEQIKPDSMRTMDCMDCHNRPAHVFQSPDKALDLSLALGRIDASIPFIKKNAVAALVQSYSTQSEAMRGIFEKLSVEYKNYPDPEKIRTAIAEVQEIYSNNFFPKMKSGWKDYPDNIGHLIWPGCFRCHDGKHKSEEGKTISADCNSCHLIIAQGPGTKLETASVGGLEFQHPMEELGDAWKEMKCSDCHTGAFEE